ncbi:MAG: peptidase domain protein [Myxococcales bacterium]|nr:peptidase domain protein [Myxococcales bacterium]
MRALAVASLLVAACHGSSGTTKRTGSAAAVEIVNQPMLPDAGGGHGGPKIDEIEPNDGDEVATPLALGGTARGKVEPETDVDHFRIDVDKPGNLSVSLSAVDADLVLEVEDATGTVIAKSDRGAVRVREGVPNLGVTPGRYTAVVRLAPAKKKPGKPVKQKRPPPVEPAKPAPTYELTAQLVPPPANSEHEPDDDRGTANDLIIGDTVTGYVGWNDDKDVWKLSTEALSAKNAIDVEVSAVEGVALELAIGDHLGQPLLERKGPRGAPLVIRGLVPMVPTGAPPFHYITVRGDKSNPETAYQLHVSEHVVPTDAEIEPDDTPEKPFLIPADRTIVHATFTPGDVDCFALAPTNTARMIEVSIDTPNEVDLSADLLIDGKVATSSEHKGKGVAEKLVAQIVAGTRVIVRVRGADPSATGEGAYDIAIQESGVDNAP